jgi:adenosylmethionine-8-amino-7-oxononanoate aminotransferase
MAAREKMGEAFLGNPEDHVQFFHGHTWAANPLGSAVGIATIDIMLKRILAERAVVLGEQLKAGLERLKIYGVIREIRGSGVLRGVELVKDDKTNIQFPESAKLGNALKKTAVKNGLIMRINPDWFAVCPSLIAEEGDIEELIGLVEKSLVEALRMI